ncbi:MAG TPA: FkbM family methyltransferase [Chryseolinea sp.]
MHYNLPKIFHSLSLRVPQAYALRSGLRVLAQTKQQNSLFWSTFTSREYMSLMPAIIKSGIQPKTFIDCGAATGYVTMLMHHLIQSGVLDWKLDTTVCIEPSSYNADVLKENLSMNGLKAEMIFGVVGKRDGDVKFFESKQHPWSSSVGQRFHSGNAIVRKYIDLMPLLQRGNCFLKVDVEGSEFDLIETYKESWPNVQGMILEWHNELGDVAAAERTLMEKGLVLAATSLDKDNRRVSLYLRQTNA